MSGEKGESSKNEEKIDTRETERMGGSNPYVERWVRRDKGELREKGVKCMSELREGREFKE